MKTKHSVLIVDDQETSIAELTKILSPEYTVYSETNGRDAIKTARAHLPDVILLDILMLDMDGYAVITELKKSKLTKGIPVIFITGLSSNEDEEKGLALGAADYIIKPFSTAIVKLRLQNQIRMLDQLRLIERLSMTDQLTDLPNRRSFESRLNVEWKRAQRGWTPISMLMVDIDHFKNYNDTYGHQQGDVVLQNVAKIFTQTIKRPGDFAARWGGEEFIVLLTDTDIGGAIIVAEQIRARVEQIEINVPGGTAKVTVSIGVYTQEPGTGGTINEFISKADAALYEAKDKGRNKVCF